MEDNRDVVHTLTYMRLRVCSEYLQLFSNSLSVALLLASHLMSARQPFLSRMKLRLRLTLERLESMQRRVEKGARKRVAVHSEKGDRRHAKRFMERAVIT